MEKYFNFNNFKAKTTKYEVVDMNGIYCRDTCP